MADDELTISTIFGCLSETVSSPRYHWRSDRRGKQQFVIIQQTLSGHGLMEWENQTWEVPEGNAFICLVPERSAYRFPPDATEPWRFSWLNFYGSLAQTLCRTLRTTYGPILPLPPRSEPGLAFRALTAQAARRSPRDVCDMTQACFHFLIEWKRLLDRPQSRSSDPVETVRRICQSRFREPLGIKELAAQAGMTREHLTRIFTERTGTSPARYLRGLRVQAARGLLRHVPEITYKEAALRCGFPSVKALHRALDAND